MQLQPDARLQGRYRIVRLIAQGGMGAVYEAVDERLGNTVALKQTLMADAQLRAAFEREARLLAGLHHPALPVVSDHFAEDGGQFLVMQFIPGDDLGALLGRRAAPFPVADVLAWGDRLLDALDYLHARTPPIIHRDVKPQNLKLTARGDLVLLDFGLAKGEPAGATNVNPSLFGYTPQYAPLEQIQGSGTDARSDLYSVAATLYELLTGVAGPDALSRAAAAVRGEPDPLRPADELRPELPRALAALLAQALALNPAMRPPSAAAMRAAMRAARDQAPAPAAVAHPSPPAGSAGLKTVTVAAGVQAPPPAPAVALAAPSPARRAPAPRRAILGGALAALLLLVAAVAVRAWPTPSPSGPTVSGATAGATRADPLPVGSLVQIPGWAVEVTESIRGARANEMVRKANPNNARPAAGLEYLLLKVRATSSAPEEQYALSDLQVVGERSVVYRSTVVPPAPAYERSGKVAPGQTLEGWLAYMVGTEERSLLAVVGSLVTGEGRMLALTPGARIEPDRSLAAIAPNNVGADPREPAGIGETAVADDWEVTVLEALRGDAAWERIYAGNRYNDPPGEGMEYIAAYVRLRSIADDDAPNLAYASLFTGAAGDEELEQPSIVEPPPELFSELFPGGSVEGWVAIQVPAGDPDARLAFRGISISTGSRDGWRYFALD